MKQRHDRQTHHIAVAMHTAGIDLRPDHHPMGNDDPFRQPRRTGGVHQHALGIRRQWDHIERRHHIKYCRLKCRGPALTLGFDNVRDLNG